MKKNSTLFRVSFVFFTLLSFIQFTVSGQNVAKRLDPPGQDTIPFLEYVPAGHSAPGSTRKYPLIVYLHGIDKKSDNPSTAPGAPVWGLQSSGPSKLVAGGHKMNFTWNSVEDSFIVISPMCRDKVRTGTYKDQPIGLWPTSYVSRILDYARANLKVDTNRIYLTGYSFGGGGTWIHLAHTADNAKRLAAAVPVAPAANHHDLWGAKPDGPQYIGEANLPVWAFHAEDDLICPESATQIPINNINNRIPAPAVKALMTIWPNGLVPTDTHSNTNPWVYDINLFPYGSEGIMNIYEWFLGQDKSKSANILPTANAGSDFSVSGSTAVLNGAASSDIDGNVIRYVWKAIAAPAGVSLSSITINVPLGTSSSATASNLTTAGNYTFRLFAVDDRAGYTTDDVVVTAGATSVTNGMTFTTNGRIQTTDVTELNNIAKFTLEAHFKYDATLSGWTTLMRRSTGLTSRIMMHITPSTNAIAVMVGNGLDTRATTPNNSIAPGNWYHVAAVYDGTLAAADRVKIYIDGVLQTTTILNGPFTTTTPNITAPFMAGGESSCCNLNGTLDEVRVWNTALTSTTINAWKDKQLGTCHPDAANLVVYWPLDDNSTPSTAAPGLSTTYTGTVVNGTYVTSTRASTSHGCSSTPPKAVTLTTTTGRIQTTDVTELNNIAKFTMEAHFKYDATLSGWTTLIRRSTALTSRIMMHITPSTNAIAVIVGNGLDTRATTPDNSIAPGNWYHVAAVYDGTLAAADRVKIYIDGVLQTTTILNGPFTTTTANITAPLMAGGESSCCTLNGTIDEVRIWNTALTSTTINEWKDKLLGSCHTNAANLVVYWPLNNDASATSAPAGLATTYVGTIVNGTYVTSPRVPFVSDCVGDPAILSDYTEEFRETITNGLIYPNPTSDLVQIQLTALSSTPVTIKVIDMYGKHLIKNQRTIVQGRNNLSVNIASLPRGIYIVEVNDGKSSLGKYKVVKR